MPLFYSDSRFLNHDTGPHPERAGRIEGIPDLVAQSPLAGQFQHPSWEPVSRQRLTQIHAPHYVESLKEFTKWGGGDVDPDTVVSPESYAVALLAAGAVCDAAERLVRGEDTRAFCLVRPPGHHALAARAMGFCLFNNVAVAAKLATVELELDRVLVVDWDVHHGNGTQAAFWADPGVGFLSIHRWPFYPGTGSREETGSGPGLGTTVNLPVPFGISRKDYHTLFADSLAALADKIKPQLVLVSAGFDSHRRDPVGSLGLETEDFGPLTAAVLDVAETHAEGRVVSVLEGGYDPDALGQSVLVHLSEMVKRSQP